MRVRMAAPTPPGSSILFHGHLEAGRLQNGVQRRKTRVAARGQGPIEALPRHARGLCDLGHAFCLRHGSQRRKIDPGVAVLRGCIEVFRGELWVRPQLGDEPLAVRDRQLLAPGSRFFRFPYSCHRSTAFLISESCFRLSPPQIVYVTAWATRPSTPGSLRAARIVLPSSSSPPPSNRRRG